MEDTVCPTASINEASSVKVMSLFLIKASLSKSTLKTCGVCTAKISALLTALFSAELIRLNDSLTATTGMALPCEQHAQRVFLPVPVLKLALLHHAQQLRLHYRQWFVSH